METVQWKNVFYTFRLPTSTDAGESSTGTSSPRASSPYPSWWWQGTSTCRRCVFVDKFQNVTFSLQFHPQVLLGEHTSVTSVWPRSVRDLLGARGLVNSQGEAHGFKRKITSKAFTPDSLDKYLVAINEIAEEKVNFYLILFWYIIQNITWTTKLDYFCS